MSCSCGRKIFLLKQPIAPVIRIGETAHDGGAVAVRACCVRVAEMHVRWWHGDRKGERREEKGELTAGQAMKRARSSLTKRQQCSGGRRKTEAPRPS